MKKEFTVSLENIIEELSLKIVYMPKSAEEILISSRDIDRPGVELAGYLKFFDEKRIIVLGHTELSYLETLSDDCRYNNLNSIIELKPPAIVLTRDQEAPPLLVELCKKFEVPILISEDTTSSFTASISSHLNVELAPRVTRHGVLVEVYGEGLLLTGDSGVGKSETAIELIKRGHRLIADDAVEIRRVSKKTLVGTSPENIRHFIELRGIGIINARRIFGMGAVKLTEKIDMVINMELWDSSKVYDRMGMDNEYTDILGIEVPILTIPVKPGRNLAVIIEVASMNNRQKKMGYNAAQELLASLGMEFSKDEVSGKNKIDWI